MRPIAHLVGRFPPPFDGQSLATLRLLGLAKGEFDVRPFDTALKNQALTPSGLRVRHRTVCHYLRLRPGLRRSLATAPHAPVLWGSISPTPSGHFRDMVATLPCFSSSQKVVAIAHRGGFDRLFRHPATAFTARRMARRVDRFVFLSHALAWQVAPWVPASKCDIIPYTVEPCISATEAADKSMRGLGSSVNSGVLRLLYLSNMIQTKGYLDVLEGIGILHARGQKVTAEFVGRWNTEADQAHFKKRVDALGLDGVVTHLGALRDRHAINERHHLADVFLLPTYYSEEAQPISIIEALSAATPVVVTRHSGIKDMVSHGRAARFVPPRSPAAIADAVIDLSDSTTWKAASRQARARYDEHFSKSVVRTKWLQLISSIT